MAPKAESFFYDKGHYSDGWRYLEAAPRETEFVASWGAYRITIGAEDKTVESGIINLNPFMESNKKIDSMAKQEISDNNFITLYKTWATDRLLDIVDNPGNYQPLAVEAARLELDSRHLTQEQLTDAQEQQNLRQQGQVNKQQKGKNIENKIKSFGSSVAGAVNPVQKGTPTTEKSIKLISLFIGGLFLYQLYKEFGMLRYMFTDSSSQWDVSVVLYFLSFILLPAAGWLFWFKKKIGWVITTIYFSSTAAGAFLMFISDLNRKPSGIPALEAFFPTPSPIVYIGTFLLFGGLTWILCKENMRQVYRVSKKSMLVVLSVGIGLVLLMTISWKL